LIPRLLHAAAAARRRITIFDDDYPTPDGTAIRDYVHVADLATAHLAALDFLDTGRDGVFNLGTGHGHSVREVIAAVAARAAAAGEDATVYDRLSELAADSRDRAERAARRAATRARAKGHRHWAD
jgi:UDP-glucose 4-epimerase